VREWLGISRGRAARQPRSVWVRQLLETVASTGVVLMSLLDTPRRAEDASASVQVAISGVVGGCLAGLVLVTGPGELAPVVGWDSAAIVYLLWTWRTIWGLDPEETARRALREDPGKIVADVLLLSASVTSLVAVGVVLLQAGKSHGLSKHLLIALGIVSVVLAWAVVHTVFALRYAVLYYVDRRGGIDFNDEDPPRYSDFAYVALTIGMTFQVSDTDLRTKEIRAAAIRHGLLSYLFGAVIIATTINLVAGFTK
jgi:uncharacterized membrane protein